MDLHSGGLIIIRIFPSEIWGLIFGKVYFWRGLLSEFYVILLRIHNSPSLSSSAVRIVVENSRDKSQILVCLINFTV